MLSELLTEKKNEKRKKKLQHHSYSKVRVGFSQLVRRSEDGKLVMRCAKLEGSQDTSFCAKILLLLRSSREAGSSLPPPCAPASWSGDLSAGFASCQRRNHCLY